MSLRSYLRDFAELVGFDGAMDRVPTALGGTAKNTKPSPLKLHRSTITARARTAHSHYRIAVLGDYAHFGPRTAAVLRDLPLGPTDSGGLICADRADCGVLITG